jgi:hypothetical protein
VSVVASHAVQPNESDGLGVGVNGLGAGANRWDFSGTAIDPFPFSGSGYLADDFVILSAFLACSICHIFSLVLGTLFCPSDKLNAGESNTATLINWSV